MKIRSGFVSNSSSSSFCLYGWYIDDKIYQNNIKNWIMKIKNITEEEYEEISDEQYEIENILESNGLFHVFYLYDEPSRYIGCLINEKTNPNEIEKIALRAKEFFIKDIKEKPTFHEEAWCDG